MKKIRDKINRVGYGLLAILFLAINIVRSIMYDLGHITYEHYMSSMMNSGFLLVCIAVILLERIANGKEESKEK